MGVISSQKINIFGEVFIGELICAVVLLFNMKAIRLPVGGKPILVLLLIWFVAQLASDFFNQTEFIKAVKGILVPAFVAIILLGLTTAFHRYYRFLPLYFLGVFIGLWLSLANGNEYYTQNPWKWGLGTTVALCFFTWIEFYCKRYRAAYLLAGSAIFVVICLANSSRSMAAFMLLASILAVLSRQIELSPLYKRFSTSPSGIFQFFCIVLVAVFFIDRLMVVLFTFDPFLNLLPPLDAFKYSVQAESKWGMILGGRTELFVSLEAFFDAPFFGHGSWSENPYYVYARLDYMDSAGGLLQEIAVAEKNVRSYLIPTHSYLMGSIVWGGFFAGLFWLKVMGITFSGFLNGQVIRSPLLLYIIISLIWNIIFSPFGADARWLSTVLLWVYMIITSESFIKWPIKC